MTVMNRNKPKIILPEINGLNKNYRILKGKSNINIICRSESIYEKPLAIESQNDDINPELIIEVHNGIIPVWAYGHTLRYTFNEESFLYFEDIPYAKNYFTELLHDALELWVDSPPIAFVRDDSFYDFQIVMMHYDVCDGDSCTFADAFYPDSGQNTLRFYPIQLHEDFDYTDVVLTMAHELGHIFGLNHTFALYAGPDRTAEEFGTIRDQSIMSYGDYLQMSEYDISDLKMFYEMVWDGELTSINEKKIVLVAPFTTSL